MAAFEFSVKGMTCNHCKMAVHNALTELPGVEKADVNLETGHVRIEVTNERPSDEAIRDAVEEAGYEAVLPR